MLPFLPVPHRKASGCSRARRGSRRQTRKELRNQTRQHNHRLQYLQPTSSVTDHMEFFEFSVSWDGNRWGVLREEVCAGLRGAAVQIERRLDGSHWLRYRGRYLHLRACPEPVRPSASPSGRRPPGLAEQPPRPKIKITPKYHASTNHPWRKPRKRTFLSGRKPDISTLR
jgi:hypothetical protein